MNIRQQLLKEHSKSNTELIASYINKNEAFFNELIRLFLSDEGKVTQRASWVVSKCTDQHPHLNYPTSRTIDSKFRQPNYSCSC